MKRLSFFTKIFSGTFIIIVLLIGLIIFFSFQAINSHYNNHLAFELKYSAFLLKDRIRPFMIQKQYKKLDLHIKSLGKEIQKRITIVDVDGVVLADSEEDPKKMENHRYRPEVDVALQDSTGRSMRYSRTVKQNMLYVAIPYKHNNKIIAVVRVSLFLSDISYLLNQLKYKVLFITLIIILISLVGIYFFSRTLSSPIRDMISASRRIAKGDFDTTIYLKNKDELGELANNFNYMTSQIRDLFNQLLYEKEHINSIILSVNEGILVINEEGEIVLANKSCKNIVGEIDLEGHPYWEVIRNHSVNELIEEIKTERKNIGKELSINDKTYISSTSVLPLNHEIVLVFHDISERKNLQKIKKDLIANVSHELRTPLTAIKGFVETIYESAGKKDKHYLDIINKHTERLINIVNDLLTLSRFEDKETSVELEDINLNKLLISIKKMFDIHLKNKGIKWMLDIKKSSTTIKADSFKLEQVFINLIDNAIKYTDKGKITISVEKIKDNIVLEIKDTGIGISEKHLSRLFERFYVIDKSRSRQSGGTGLGLSIVKYIVLLHDGEIKVKSVPDKGTTFTITLPQ